ncbi:zinc finger protein 182-like, partial [Diaphorina citri]|uniref:Zinc finger protein 182-like n=1 Tax=Diaphorina citri TaxID=121845 RepID=A0A1S4EKW9_DIACI
MATPEMLQPAVQLIELERDSQVHRSNKLGIKQDVSSIFGKKYKPKIIIASPSHQAGGSSGANEPRPFACMFCPAAFKNEAALVAHVRVHVNGNTVHGALNGVNGNVAKQVVHSCVYCNRSFKQQTNLEIHMRTYHSYGDASGSQHQTYSSVNQAQAALNASYMSGLALWEYKNLEQQNQQQQSQQQESGEESAAEGGREGQGEGHNVKTEKREEEGEYRAPDGTAVTWEKVSKKYKPKIIIASPSHQAGGSSGANEPRPFACMFCPAAFKNEAALVAHVRVHVNGNAVHGALNGVNGNVAKQVVHSCVYCNRSFKQQTNLEIHMRTYHSYGDASGSQHQTYSSVNQAQAALNASYMSGLALWEYKNLEQANQQQQSQQQESGEESAAEGGREGQGEGHNVKTEKKEEEGEYRAPDGTAVTWEK